MSDLSLRQIPTEMESHLKAMADTTPPEEAARLLANTLNRAVALLHKQARDQATARKGQKDWVAWAKLANASRTAVLAASMCRELANQMAAASRAEEEQT